MTYRWKAQGDLPMTATNSLGKKAGHTIRYAIAGVLASALLAGAASAGKVANANPDIAKAQTALAKGKVDRAVALAEQAVAAVPRDASARVILAQSYMKAGRFDSAATTFNDAMELGDNSPRTALALALANVAAGRAREAVAILDDWRESIPASDLGLAYALAGESGRGVAILADSLRSGENTPKLRQNLAYAYALDGRWREARMMVEMDVPADQVDARVSEWAAKALPEQSHQRVAALLGVPVISDSGQPQNLALAASPAVQQAAAETAEVPASQTADLPVATVAEVAAFNAPVAVAATEPAPVSTLSDGPLSRQALPQSFAAAFTQPAQPAYSSQPAQVGFVSNPVIQALPARAERATRAERAAPVATRRIVSGGSHLVQLGAFSSEQGARRAWGIYAAKNPELRNYRMTITPAVVRGKNYWRVAAAGFDARAASGLCSTVKGRGGACFAYAATNPPASGVPGRHAAGPQRARRR